MQYRVNLNMLEVNSGALCVLCRRHLQMSEADFKGTGVLQREWRTHVHDCLCSCKWSCVCVCILCLCYPLIHSALYQLPSISVWQAADVERGQIAAPINAFDLHTLTVTNTLADASVTTDVFLTWKKCDSNSHCLCLKGPSVTINDRRIQSKSPSNSPKAMVGNDKWQRN